MSKNSEKRIRGSPKEKGHLAKLFNICKDADGLDRARLRDLDIDELRTEYARKLPLIAGA